MIAKKSDSKISPLPIDILNVGLYYQEAGKEPEFDITPPQTERMELVTGGRGWVDIDGAWIEVMSGALLWHVEGESTIARSDHSNPYRCLTISFKSEKYQGNRSIPRLSWWEDVEEVGRFVSEVVRWHCHDQFDKKALLSYVYGRLLFQSRVWQQLGKHKVLPERLQEALRMLEARAADPIRLFEVAKKVGWSEAYLYEIFQEKLQTTPHEIVIRQRMHMARERLAGSDQSIKRIAAECGFSSASAFCHTFKTRIGISPLEYRRKESGKIFKSAPGRI